MDQEELKCIVKNKYKELKNINPDSMFTSG